VLAAAAIVWFYASTGTASLRDTDSWVADGIQLLGIPLLIVFFALGCTAWMRRTSVPAEPSLKTLTRA